MTQTLDMPTPQPGRLAGTSTVVLPAAESGSFSRLGQRDDTDALFVGRYSSLHGHQFAKIRFPDLVADLRPYSCGERLLLRNLHCYSRYGLKLMEIRAGIGEVSPKRLTGVEYVALRHWPVPGGVAWLDITRVTMPSSTVIQLSAPNSDPYNYGSFAGADNTQPPRVELTFPGGLAYVGRLLEDLWKGTAHG